MNNQRNIKQWQVFNPIVSDWIDADHQTAALFASLNQPVKLLRSEDELDAHCPPPRWTEKRQVTA